MSSQPPLMSQNDLNSSDPSFTPDKVIHIRIARSELSDAKAAGDLGREVFTVTFGYSATPIDLEAHLESQFSPNAMLDLINDRKRRLLLGLDGDEVVGFADLAIGTTEACLEGYSSLIELRRLYVDIRHHGRGTAKRLMEETITLARHEGYQNIWLGVWAENPRAVKFYEKCGFRKVGDHDFWIGGTLYTDDVYVRSLTP